MLSRVADSIYWVCRYVERAENVARVIDVNLNLMLDLPQGSFEQWEPLVLATADLPLFQKRFSEPSRSNVMAFLTFDEENPNSIVSCLRAARENARSVRDVLPSDMWEQLNTYFLLVNRQRGMVGSEPHRFFAEVKRQGQLFGGIMDAAMIRDEGWHFGSLGRMLERADMTSRILDVKYFILLPDLTEVGSPLDTLQWSALLRSCSALESYRRRHGRISPDHVAEFLLLDRAFPRSIHFCLARAQDSLHVISGSAPGTFRNPAEQLLGRLCARLAYARIEEVVSSGLHEFLDWLQLDVNDVGDAVYRAFIAPLTEASDRGGRDRVGAE